VSLVFAAIAPHGTLPEAPVENADATHAALATLGERFDAADPETTIVLTPHNVHVEGHFAVVLAGAMAGSLAEFGAADVHLSVPVDVELALRCVSALHDDDIPVVGASFGANDPSGATAPMDWGVLIPLWAMGGRREPPVPIVVVSPARDLSLEQHVRAGRALARAAEESGKRVGLIASADHGHAHDAAGPYGFDPAAADYDRQVVELVQQDRLADLLELDPQFVDAAKADSWWQLLMLYGALGEGWRAEFLSYEASTYFGMLCAAYAPN
jgi:aromatic ring-opening dioxygenase LigB subunit